MLNAEEARIKSAKRMQEIVEEQLKKIEERINKACEDGEFEVLLDFLIKKETATELQEKGYTVKPEENLTYITWLYDEDGEDNDDKQALDKEPAEVDSVEDAEENSNEIGPDETEEISFEVEEESE